MSCQRDCRGVECLRGVDKCEEGAAVETEVGVGLRKCFPLGDTAAGTVSRGGFCAEEKD